MVRIGVGHIREIAGPVVFPGFDLPRIVRNNEIDVTVIVEIDESGLEGVLLVVEAAGCGLGLKAVIAAVDQ